MDAEAPFALTRQDVDLEEQRCTVDAEKWRDHVKWCDRQSELQRMSLHQKRIALKILVDEAFRRDMEWTGNDNNAAEEEIKVVKEEWKQIGREVLQDMCCFDNSATVLKNLSCMSVFVLGQVSRTYGENLQERQNRIERQREILMRLREQNLLFSPSH